jgi:hypothetical protein
VWLGFDQPRTIISNGYAGDLAVPLWAGFMKEATKGDKPQWYSPPRGVIGVNVCRLSGRLPNDGCDAVDVLKDDGSVESRSMVYTEYFLRGKQPAEQCPLHPGTSFFDRVAGLFGRDGQPPLPPDQAAVATGAVEPPSSQPSSREQAIEPAASEDPPPQPQKKKRGFWARVFGVGKGDDEKKGRDERTDDRRQRRDDEDR